MVSRGQSVLLRSERTIQPAWLPQKIIVESLKTRGCAHLTIKLTLL